MNTFINPYTFVPVEKGEKKNIRDYYGKDAELLSGKIECTLKTRTQMSICEAETDKKFGFFSVDGKPVIPGSTIRGVIRNVYETLTDSCFSSTNADDDDYFSSRLSKKECGLLEYKDGRYILYQAKRYKDEHNSYLGDFPEGKKVTFDSYLSGSGTISYLRNVKESGGKITGYVHKVDRFKGKIKGKPIENLDSIFEQTDKKGTEISEKYVERLQVNISMGEMKNKKEYEKLFAKMKKGEALLPVWYTKDEKSGHYYFAASQMSRAVFYNKPIDILEKHKLDKCTDKKNICEACALFGMIGDNDNSISSRLRFSDAECLTNDPLEKDYIKVIMGSPRLSSFEFYLRYNGDNFTADTYGVNIAGRKFYWHNNSGEKLRSTEKEQPEMERYIQLLKNDVRFRFNVYFDNITEDQLKKLLFALDLGDNSIDSNKCHKIGHGKPLGLGSAKIVCDKVTVRKFEYPSYEEKERNDLIDKADDSLFRNKENVDYLLKVADFNAVGGEKISYPYYDNKDEIYEWFSKNRWKTKGKMFHRALPRLKSDNQELPCHPEPDNNGNGGYTDRKSKPYQGKMQFGDSSSGGFMSSIKQKGKKK